MNEKEEVMDNSTKSLFEDIEETVFSQPTTQYDVHTNMKGPFVTKYASTF